jgi:hypothetical protein
MNYMKSWFLRILASLLVASLCSAILTTVLNQTILNVHYLEAKFAAVNGYNRLSTALSDDTAQQAGLSNVPGAANVVQGIVNPTVVQQRVDTALSELQSYYKGNGSAPTLNFSDLATQAQSAGIPLQQNSDLFHPIAIGPSGNGSTHVRLNSDAINKVTIATSVLLTLLVLALSLVWQRYTVLPSALISVGFFMAVIALVSYFALGNISHYVKLASTSNSFAALGRDLAQNIGRDLARRFGAIAAVCLVAGIATRIWAGRMQQVAVKPQSPNLNRTVIQ